MRTKGLSLLVFTLLIGVIVAVIVQTLPPSPLPVNAPAAEFSAERAVQHIQIIAQQPRLTGSSAYGTARDYILGVLKEMGLETDVQREGNLENVVGRIVGTRFSDALLLTAHLDSVAQSPGATDDGSGVAVLLETARALISAGRLPNTIMFLFTDNEEGGSIGARAFLAHHPWARDVRIVLGFDAGGLRGPGVLSATSPNNGWLIRQIADADPSITGSSAINALASSSTDFGHAFKPAGVSGYAFDLYWDRRIHSPQDNIENINLPSIQHQGDHALSLARHFGNLEKLADPREPDAVYFSVLRLFTIAYSSTWAIPFAIAITGVFSGVLILGLRRHLLTWGGMSYGTFVMLAGVLLAALPSLLLGKWIHAAPVQFIGCTIGQSVEVIMVGVLAVALVIPWYFLSLRIRSANLPDLTMGALVPLWVGMLAGSIALPALSFAFTWSLLLSLLACVNWFSWFPSQKSSKTVIPGLLISGACSIIILGPTILLGLFDQPSLALLLLGALVGFLAPQIHLILGRPIASKG